jgi:hypothetical protein
MADVVNYRPKLSFQCAFNAEPNSHDVPVWSDLTAMFRRLDSPYSRGRPWELVQGQAALTSIEWRDPNEYLNPENTLSPYYPNVEPLREIVGQAMWPHEGVTGGLGADVNLINTGRWMPNDEEAPDPSFEAYANGDPMPGWLTAVGSVVPTVSTTDPQQGGVGVSLTMGRSGGAGGLRGAHGPPPAHARAGRCCRAKRTGVPSSRL